MSDYMSSLACSYIHITQWRSRDCMWFGLTDIGIDVGWSSIPLELGSCTTTADHWRRCPSGFLRHRAILQPGADCTPYFVPLPTSTPNHFYTDSLDRCCESHMHQRVSMHSYPRLSSAILLTLFLQLPWDGDAWHSLLHRDL